MLTSRSVLQVLQWVWQHSEEDSTFYGPYGIEQVSKLYGVRISLA